MLHFFWDTLYFVGGEKYFCNDGESKSGTFKILGSLRPYGLLDPSVSLIHLVNLANFACFLSGVILNGNLQVHEKSRNVMYFA